MDIKTAGIALFFLIYLYVWFKNYKRAHAITETFHTASFGDIMRALSLSQLEMFGIIVIIFLALFTLVVICFREWSMRIFNNAFDMTSIRCALAWTLEDKVDYALQLGVIVPALLILTLAGVLTFVRMDPAPGKSVELFYQERAQAVARASVLGSASARVHLSKTDMDGWPLRRKIKYGLVYGFVTLSDIFFLPFCPGEVAQKSMTRLALMLNLLPMCLVILLVYNDFHIESFNARWAPKLRLGDGSVRKSASSTHYTLTDFMEAARIKNNP